MCEREREREKLKAPILLLRSSSSPCSSSSSPCSSSSSPCSSSSSFLFVPPPSSSISLLSRPFLPPRLSMFDFLPETLAPEVRVFVIIMIVSRSRGAGKETTLLHPGDVRGTARRADFAGMARRRRTSTASPFLDSIDSIRLFRRTRQSLCIDCIPSRVRSPFAFSCLMCDAGAAPPRVRVLGDERHQRVQKGQEADQQTVLTKSALPVPCPACLLPASCRPQGSRKQRTAISLSLPLPSNWVMLGRIATR